MSLYRLIASHMAHVPECQHKGGDAVSYNDSNEVIQCGGCGTSLAYDGLPLTTLALIVIEQLTRLNQTGVKIMAAIDDLKAAIADELSTITAGQATQTQLLTDIDSAVTRITTPGVSDADISAAASQISQATATLKSENAATATAATKIEAALAPVAPPVV